MKLDIKGTLQNYKRVLAISKKPDYDELKTTLRICAIGITIIGVVGFTVYIVANIPNLLK